MAAPAGNVVGLNLGPLFAGQGSHVPLNLGVDWNVDPPDPPDPVARGLRSARGLAWRGYTATARKPLRPTWGVSPRVQRTGALPWMQARRLARAAAMAWSLAPSAMRAIALAWKGRMPRATRAAAMRWRSAPAIKRVIALAWRQQGRVHSRAPVIGWHGQPPRASRATALRWRGVLAVARRTVAPAWRYPGLARAWRWIPWGVARRVPWIVLPPRPPRPPDPPDWMPDGRYVALNLGCAVVDIPGLAPLNLGMDACYLVRPHRRTYIVRNTVEVVRLPDETPIEVMDIGIAGGADAFGWTLDMTLADGSQLALLTPNAGGPRQVRVTLNGHVWTFIVESHARTREFGGHHVRVSGRSRTALLGGPYAPARTKVTDAQRSAAQLVDEELASTGYEAEYGTVDWLVPPGAFFYEATTPLDAIARVASASGAVVQSDPAELLLAVRPRYPASPWSWTETAPDHVIPDDLVSIESLQVRSAPLYNAVVVAGELQGKGVIATVTRAGEGGDLYAPMASDPLINTDTVAIERGRNLLSDRGEQAAIEQTLPMFPAPLAPGLVGRVLPLDLVQVQAAEDTWHGLCTGVRIDVRQENGATVIEQTITLERHFSDAD